MRKRIALGLSTGGFAVAVSAALIASTGVTAPLAARNAGSHQVFGLAQGVQPAPPAEGPGAPDQTAGTTSPAAKAPSVAAAGGSIAYLTQRYGVSQAEARRRLELQQRSTAIAESLAQRFPDQFGGLWLDQAEGGVLKANMTDPAKLTGVADVKPVKAKWSLRQLQRAADEVAAAVGADNVATAVDPVSNQVVVRAGGRLSTSDPGLAAAVTASDGAARVETTTAQQFEPKSCDPLRCGQAPLRAGIRLDIPRDDGTVGGCSVGLRLRSAVTDRQFVLTAGHCVVSPTHTHVDNTWHQWLGPRLPVSVESSDTRLAENDPSTGRDYAVMPFRDDARPLWFGGDIRTRTQYPNVINYQGHDDLRVTGFTPFASVVVGSVVCASGSGYTPAPGEPIVDSGAGVGYVPGTHCGEVTGKGSMINVRICARRGDSGGPLFTEADGKVLGILSGGDPRNGACVSGDTETNSYAPISTILDRVNSRTSGAYNFELAPSGSVPGPAPTRLPPSRG